MKVFTILAALLLLLAGGPGIGQAPSAPASAAPGPLRFERLNRDYRNIVSEIEPIRQGAATIRLSSPRHTLTIRDHLLRLEPGPGGSHSAELRLDISGTGWLIADVDVAGMGGRFQDEVQVPAQSRTIEGRVRLRKTAEGYLVTPEQLPKQVPVRIRSNLAGDVVALCEGAALLTGMDCGALERSLSIAQIPLPEPGESYLLENSELTADERRRIDAYLASGTR